MIHALIMMIIVLTTTLNLAQWSSTAAKDLKQPVNFSGKLTTHQGQEFDVDNISIYGKYTKISMALKPENLSQPERNPETKQYEVKLTTDPNEVTRDIDLDEIKQINVPAPETLYVYQKKERGKKLEFVEVEVISSSGKTYSYLLDPKTPIYCDGIDSAGPQETTVKLCALKTLTIDGYTYRDTSADKKKKCKANDCPPCAAKSTLPSQ